MIVGRRETIRDNHPSVDERHERKRYSRPARFARAKENIKRTQGEKKKINRTRNKERVIRCIVNRYGVSYKSPCTKSANPVSRSSRPDSFVARRCKIHRLIAEDLSMGIEYDGVYFQFKIKRKFWFLDSAGKEENTSFFFFKEMDKDINIRFRLYYLSLF